MRPFFVVAFASIAALLLTACGPVQGSGKIGHRTLAPGGEFRNLRVEGSSRLTVRTGGAPSIEVEADDNLLELVHAEAKDGLLRVWTDGAYQSDTPMQITITAASLAQVATAGAVKATVDAVEGDTVALTADGASVLDVAATRAKSVQATARGASTIRVGIEGAENVTVVAKGVSEVVAKGHCANADLNIEGASKSSGLTAVKANVVAFGATTVDIDASESLRIDASGASTVTYGGEAKVEGSVNKTSTIEKRPEKPLPEAK